MQNHVIVDKEFGELAAGYKSFSDAGVVWYHVVVLALSGLKRNGTIWGSVALFQHSRIFTSVPI